MLTFLDNRRALASLAVLWAALAGLVLISRQSAPNVLIYVFLLSGSAAIITALLWRSENVGPRMVFAGALLAHAITLAGGPAFEDDYYRFIWDGWRTLQDGTPYGVAPNSFFTDDRIPAAIRSVLDGINNPEYPTIYGPVLQFVFAGVYALFGANPLGLQLLFAATNLIVIALLSRRHSGASVALYAWNPLVIAETSLHLHPDGLLAAALVAALAFGKARPIAAGLLFGVAAGVKLVALAAWPLLLRMRPAALLSAIGSLGAMYFFFLVQGQGAGFDSTATFASLWHFNPVLYEPLFQVFGRQEGRILAVSIAGLLVLWCHARSLSMNDVPLSVIFGIILLFAPAVNSWYLLWLLPFAVGRKQIWPFAATMALPFSYVTGLNLGDPDLQAFAVHPLARVAEWSILLIAICADWQRGRSAKHNDNGAPLAPIINPKIAVIMPALNEEASINGVIIGVKQALPEHLQQVIVVDNGCTDNTKEVASAAGATVVSEAERGYGAACLKGISQLNPDINIVLFMDSDGSDVTADAAKILEPIINGSADFVIGSRALGKVERGAMTVPQRFGNWLAPILVRIIWNVRYTDLGPFRAIRRSSLDALLMQDRDFGWTIEMQVRAAKLGIPAIEVATGYRRRIGVSKISGTIDGVLKAGTKILYVIGREAFGDFDAARRNR